MKISEKKQWQRLERLMQQHCLSKKDIAEIAGVGPSAVTKWASGGAIRMQNLRRLAIHFSVDPITLEADDGYENSQQSESEWKERALEAERKLKYLRDAIRSFNDVVAKLEGAL